MTLNNAGLPLPGREWRAWWIPVIVVVFMLLVSAQARSDTFASPPPDIWHQGQYSVRMPLVCRE